MHKFRTEINRFTAFFIDILMVYVAFMVCRIMFVWENWDVLGKGFAELDLGGVLVGSLYFDTSAICYLNVVFAIMMLFPVPFRSRNWWQQAARVVFVLCNGLGIVANLADCVYFQYTGRRTTTTVFSEFANEDNLWSVMWVEVLQHWYIVLLGMLLIYCLWKFFVKIGDSANTFSLPRFVLDVVIFLMYIPLTIMGVRGGVSTAVRPITISNANQYVNHPVEAAAILNTPFSIIRTLGKSAFAVPDYFPEDQLSSIYSPEHIPDSYRSLTSQKNVVILILESFGREYIGAYNEKLEGGQYKGYTPFVDSLYQHCMSFDYTFCNGRKSIDGMPSILSSIPMFVEPFFLTPASMNDVSGIAGELGKVGYSSAFFHGAQNGSMGFQAFARTSGFQAYYGKTEYKEDKRFDGDKDFDGVWAIWDEPFLQFYALKMTEMKEPFVTAVFTASSHHPYRIPERYRTVYPEEGGNVMHKCIRYVDHALQHFFDTARQQPWFENTVFVLTSDHTNISDHAEYQTDLGSFGSPILIYDPSAELFPKGRLHKTAQQIDIMPTLLEALGYPNPYVAFGKNLMETPDSLTWAINYNNGIYQYVRDGYLLQFDGAKTIGLYDINDDWMLSHNLSDNESTIQIDMESQTKAIIQQYMWCMRNNALIYNNRKD